MKSKPRVSEVIKTVCNRQLTDFVAQTPGVVLAQLTTADGFAVASQPQTDSVPAKLAAMTSSMQALTEAIVAESGQHRSRNVIIESEDGHLVLMGISGSDPPMSLLVVANRSAILGHLLWSARNCSSTLGDLLGYQIK